MTLEGSQGWESLVTNGLRDNHMHNQQRTPFIRKLFFTKIASLAVENERNTFKNLEVTLQFCFRKST